MSNLVDKVFDKSVPAITKVMDLALKRNEAITSNIANAETPGYRAVDVDFGGELERAFQSNPDTGIKKTHTRHMDLETNGTSRYVEDYSGATRADGNNVDLDIQMGKLVLNSGKFSSGASMIRKKLQMMRQAIRQAMR